MASQTNQRSDAKYAHLMDETGGMTEDNVDREVPDVIRTTDSFPCGHHTDLSVADLPDTERGFAKTAHYEDRKAERRNPSVTDQIITSILRLGVVNKVTPRDDSDRRYLVQKEINNREWTLVVAKTHEESESEEEWVLITVYSNYHGSTGISNRYLDRLKQRRGESE